MFKFYTDTQVESFGLCWTKTTTLTKIIHSSCQECPASLTVPSHKAYDVYCKKVILFAEDKYKGTSLYKSNKQVAICVTKHEAQDKIGIPDWCPLPDVNRI